MTTESREICVYQRANGMFFSPVSFPAGGGCIEHGPSSMLEADATAEMIGEQVRHVASYSRHNYEYDREAYLKDKQEDLQQLAGVKSQSAFHKQAKQVGVELYPDKIVFRPLKKKGSSTYLGQRDEIFEIDGNASAEQIGRALLDAFERAKK